MTVMMAAEEFLHVNHAVTTDDFSNEAIIAAISSDEQESMIVVISRSLTRDRVPLESAFAKDLSFGWVQHSDTLQRDENKIVSKQPKLTDYALLAKKLTV